MFRSYKVWWPEDGETEEDAHVFPDCWNHEDAAQDASEYDYLERGGWESSPNDSKPIMVKDIETGEVQRFKFWWEQSTEHHAERDEQPTPTPEPLNEPAPQAEPPTTD